MTVAACQTPPVGVAIVADMAENPERFREFSKLGSHNRETWINFSSS
jgi:hypothetical protein